MFPYVEAISEDVPITQEFVGQTYGTFDINIRARVEGFLEGRHFQEGSEVKKGAVIIYHRSDSHLRLR